MKHSKFPLIGGQFVNVVYFDSKQTSPTGFSNFSYIECSNSYPIIEVKQWNLVPIDLSIPLLFGTAKSNRQLKSSFAIIPGPPTHLDHWPPSSCNFLEEHQNIIIHRQPNEDPKIMAKRQHCKEQRKTRKQLSTAPFNDNQSTHWIQ